MIRGGHSLPRLLMPFTETDTHYMTLALKLARRGEGFVEPNPMVGCVIVKNEAVIGKGYHRRFGGPHAEIEALRACRKKPGGATLYCTLEPCSHFGKTPPCANAIIQAGIARVVIPRLDPNLQVNGNGVRLLRRAGIKVEVGLRADKANELLRPFLTRVVHNRPYVIAKWAQSLDGQLVIPEMKRGKYENQESVSPRELKFTARRESRWISGEMSRRRVHQLRARVDAIMVGAGTVLGDDPMLTARDVQLRRVAMRWVLDGGLRIPTTARLVRTARRFATVIFTTEQKSESRKAAVLLRAGVEVLPFKARNGHIALQDILEAPMFSCVTNMLVEGGPKLLNHFFRNDLIDEAHVYVAPRLFVSPREPHDPISFGGRSPTSITSDRSGEDVLYTLLYPTTAR